LPLPARSAADPSTSKEIGTMTTPQSAPTTSVDHRLHDDLLALVLREDGNPADAAESWVSDATTLVEILAQNDLRTEPSAPRQVVAEVSLFFLQLARVLQAAAYRANGPGVSPKLEETA
jgi:hypothetical protein